MTDSFKALFLASVVVLFLLPGCSGGNSAAPGDAWTGIDANAPVNVTCKSCLEDSDCQVGQHCVQFPANDWCEQDCVHSQCARGYACQAMTTASGDQVSVCVPVVNTCEQGGGGGNTHHHDVINNTRDESVAKDPGVQVDTGQNIHDNGNSGGGIDATGPADIHQPHDTGHATDSGSNGNTTGKCGNLDLPDTPSCCHSCDQSSPKCQKNGCYGGWYCNPDTCKCQSPPASCDNSGGGNNNGGNTTGKCGNLDLPDTPSCCHSCDQSSSKCQKNGCYGGWYCNPDTCKCQSPPSDCGTSGGGNNNGGTTAKPKPGGLSFAIIGDTRPPFIDDTIGYPVSIITKIWKDVLNQQPLVEFAITTGDYVFADPYLGQASKQLDKYLQAQSLFPNPVYPTMGNHECTGWTKSNCLSLSDSKNFKAFMEKLVAPVGASKPYYVVQKKADDGSWTAKFVFIAANSWDNTQAQWLDHVMAQKTTYTFVIRHEPPYATTAPGVSPSDRIIQSYPYTLLICGHTHTYRYDKYKHYVIVGNGGAPLSGHVNYGYVIARQQTDNSIRFTEYDYSSNAVGDSFAVQPDGTPVP